MTFPGCSLQWSLPATHKVFPVVVTLFQLRQLRRIHDNLTISQRIRGITIVNAFQLDDDVLIVVTPAFQLDLFPLTGFLDKPGW